MAHMFPDCIGEVDVVSDAENIKRLLKIPYSNKSVIKKKKISILMYVFIVQTISFFFILKIYFKNYLIK